MRRFGASERSLIFHLSSDCVALFTAGWHFAVVVILSSKYLRDPGVCLRVARGGDY